MKKLILLPFAAILTCAWGPCATTQLSTPLAVDVLTIANTAADSVLSNYAAGKSESITDLAQGALAQVRTLEGTGAITGPLISDAVNRVITDPVLASAVTSAATKTIDTALNGGKIDKSAAIESAMLALDQAFQSEADKLAKK